MLTWLTRMAADAFCRSSAQSISIPTANMNRTHADLTQGMQRFERGCGEDKLKGGRSDQSEKRWAEEHSGHHFAHHGWLAATGENPPHQIRSRDDDKKLKKKRLSESVALTCSCSLTASPNETPLPLSKCRVEALVTDGSVCPGSGRWRPKCKMTNSAAVASPMISKSSAFLSWIGSHNAASENAGPRAKFCFCDRKQLVTTDGISDTVISQSNSRRDQPDLPRPFRSRFHQQSFSP